MPMFTARMASPRSWRVTFRIGARNGSRGTDAHRVALFSRPIGQSTNGQTTLKRVRHSVNGKAI